MPHKDTAAGGTGRRPLRVLQFGGGNFLRAFVGDLVQALNEQTAFNSGIVLVKPTAGGDYAALREQGGAYHLLIEGIESGRPVRQLKRISGIQEIVHPYRDWAAYLRTATLPAMRFVVSNTTEAGIAFEEEALPEGQPAHSFPGKLTQWLYHRYKHFAGAAESGCIFLPCELIPANGAALRACILRYAQHWHLEDAFQEWIAHHNIFCNTLVDRIVPGKPEQPAPIWAEIGMEDQQLVMAEPYLLWAIEAPEEVKAALPFGQIGLNVVFTDDLQRYRTLKVRILNGAHTAMVPVGLYQRISTVREFVEHPQWGQWLRSLLAEEVAPTLPYPAAETEAYTQTVLDRFSNPAIHHKLSDIALNSVSKFQVRVLPSLLKYHQQTGTVPTRMALSMAALIWLYRGTFPGLPKDDPAITTWFRQLWNTGDHLEITRKVLSNKDLWGKSDLSFLTSAVAGQLKRISQGADIRQK